MTMERYLQLHTLTSFAPSNLNRDDTGRPKTATIGGSPRLRISSQSLKRAIRTSDVYRDALAGHVGTRTRSIGERVLEKLVAAKVPEKDAKEWASKVAGQFAKVEKDAAMKQLAHVSPEELTLVDDLADRLAREKRPPKEDELVLLRKSTKAADIAMFGRMLADAPKFNVDAAVQVAHSFTIHPVTVEDDYFTAVDDLAPREETGAGHVNAQEFGAGVFYNYACINREQLRVTLDDETLAAKSIRAFTEALLTVPPSGKQNSFASRAFASYALAERTNRQPRSLAVAFLDGVQPPLLSNGITAIRSQRDRFDAAYGQNATAHYELDAHHGKGKLDELLRFVTE
jgi:CRISPR system Cascade subunit CasC